MGFVYFEEMVSVRPAALRHCGAVTWSLSVAVDSADVNGNTRAKFPDPPSELAAPQALAGCATD